MKGESLRAMPMTEPLPISCYIRTLNEERRIGEVVARAKELCEQVIVIDSGSTDRTLPIAAEAGAEVIRQPWLGNGHQKRVGEEHARHDWLFDLDADEVLTPELIAEIRREFAGTGPKQQVYQLRLTLVDPGGRRWERSGVAFRAKLYDRRVVRMPAERAWDQLSIPAAVRVGRLHGALLHYAFTDMSMLIRKQDSAMRNRVTGMPRRSHLGTCLRIVCGFPVYFLKYLLFRGLWRVGVYGWCFSFVCAFSRWGRDVKLYERDWLASASGASDASASPVTSDVRRAA